MDWADLAGPFPNGLLGTVAKLVAAALAGLLIGIDREARGHAAGLRTHAIVAVAAAATAVMSLELYRDLLAAHPGTNADPLRIVEGLITAVGFLGGGLIIRSGGRVRGLTTAANLWACGIVGLAFGAGLFVVGLVTLVLCLLLLVVFRPIEERLFADRRPDKPDGG